MVNGTTVRLTITPTSSYTIWIANGTRKNAPKVQVRNAANDSIVLGSSAGELTFDTAAGGVYVVERTARPLGSFGSAPIGGSPDHGQKTLSGTAARLGSGTGSPPAGSSGVSINAGGAASGTFVADAYSSGGSTYSTTNTIDTSQLTGTVPPRSVLQTERYGEFTYTVPGLTAGNPYTVILYLAESYWTAAGQRTFDVAIDGAPVLTAFDIFAAAGGANRAIARTFRTSANASGQVVIAFTRGGGPDNPKVCAITVASGGDTTGNTSTGRLVGAQSGRCLDVPNLSQANGTKLAIWDCNGGLNQQWTQTASGAFQVYGGMCLELPSGVTAAGTQVQIWGCNGATHQRWRFNADGTISSVATGLCLDVTGQGTANGTAVVVWTCNGGSNQRWSR